MKIGLRLAQFKAKLVSVELQRRYPRGRIDEELMLQQLGRGTGLEKVYREVEARLLQEQQRLFGKLAEKLRTVVQTLFRRFTRL